MTNQEYFDKVWQYFVVEGHPQAVRTDEVVQGHSNYEGCLYKTKNGNGCAVGCAIPDDIYNPAIEGCGVSELLEYVEYQYVFDEVSLSLMEDLQEAHDGYLPSNYETSFQEYMRGCLEEIAEYRKLSIPK